MLRQIGAGLLIGCVACTPLAKESGELADVPAVATFDPVASIGPDGRPLLRFDTRVVDGDDARVECDTVDFSFSAEIAFAESGQAFTLEDEDFQISCGDTAPAVASLVVDNSGSAVEYLDALTEAVHSSLDALADQGSRAGLVRVSTQAAPLRAPDDDTANIREAVDDLYVSKGWTALYDGIRMGIEQVGDVILRPDESADICAGGPAAGVLVFTDGADNNSQGERLEDDNYPGDGVDTTLTSLKALKPGGTSVPVFTIGMGDEAAHQELASLADATGGRHIRTTGPERLAEVFALGAEYFSPTQRACVNLDPSICGAATLVIKGQMIVDGVSHGVDETLEVDIPCGRETHGRVATLLLALTDPELPEDFAAGIVNNLAGWATHGASPSVAVIFDDTASKEHRDEADWLEGTLVASGYAVTRIAEPGNQLDAAALAPFDVVWFSNPGHPIDDAASIAALDSVVQRGGTVILQGDDISRGADQAALESLTGLRYRDNGARACGIRIDNGRGDAYVLVSAPHAITSGLEGDEPLYSNDIDKTELASPDDTAVLMRAHPKSDSTCEPRPVLTLRTVARDIG